MASNSGAARTSHRHKIAFGQFLAVVSWLLVIFATSASGAALEKTVGSVNPNNPQLLKPERHLDEEEPEEIDSATSNLEDEADADGDEGITEVIDEIDNDEINQESGIENNPCDLCQGMTILNDVGVGHHLVTSDDRWNCADANLFFQNPDFDPNFFSDTPLETIDIPNPYPCRALPAFNTAFEKCCQPTIPFYDCEANVAESLFGDGGSYGMIQRAIPPIVSGDQKVNVTVWLVYQALEDIDEEAGTATIFVTLILRWNDPRLKWDINDEKCTNVIDVWTSHTSAGDTQIWTPDFDLINHVDGMQENPDVKAIVYSDGTVLFSQSGGIKAFCAFRGLGRIPFDTLGCQFSFGSISQTRAHSDLLRYVPFTPDFTWTSSFRSTYNEWHVAPELTEQGTDNNGFMYFNFYFLRAEQHYVGNILTPTIILTYLSFVGFLLDMRIGERLGYGIALALVIVAQQIITSSLLPVSYNKLFLDKLVQWSFYWVVVVILESAFIGFIYFYRQDKLEDAENDAPDEEVNEEERQPLSKSARQDETQVTTSESHPGCFSKFRNMILRMIPRWFWKFRNTILVTCPTRLIDFTFLFLCVSTYTIFLVVMFMTAKHGTLWLRNEPAWDSELSTVSAIGQPYPNMNPYN